MAQQEFWIKKGDILPVLQATLQDKDDVAVDLTGGAVLLVYQFYTAAAAVERTAEIVSAVNGTVKYQWVAGDTAAAGTARAEWRVTFPGAKPSSFPNDGYFLIHIVEKLSP